MVSISPRLGSCDAVMLTSECRIFYVLLSALKMCLIQSVIAAFNTAFVYLPINHRVQKLFEFLFVRMHTAVVFKVVGKMHLVGLSLHFVTAHIFLCFCSNVS